ncbi:MAG: two-component sensor histidine kinase [Sphingomonadales bacterium]|nr:two-component sensor histidine kinase [Sphingomonadales bacterium]MBD3772783.1 two-component sensor histidine kinase [Paracoccaceae bacterium]
MHGGRNIPWTGFFFAFAAFAGLLVMRIDFWLALAVLLLWCGTLWLSSATPPEVNRREDTGPFTRDSLAQLVEHSGTPILFTEKSRITMASRSAREMLGAHIVGQDVRVALRHPEAIALFDRGGSGSVVIHGLARRRDIWRMSRQAMGGGTALVELINQTAEADISRAHTDFVANASHELRTPLASIIGYVETLQEGQDDGKTDPATARRFLDTIHREARRLQSLVNDLMSLSRVEAEKHDQPAETVSLRPLVERAARDAAGAERMKRLQLDCDVDCLVLGDAQQLEQLVRNLVDNALKYGDHDKPVTVTLIPGDRSDVELQVADQGEGIAAEHLPHLTRRFYRTDPGRSRASGGTGLGLAIVKHIVERHRGRLDIRSKQGSGTTVSVRIPLKPASGE